MNTKAHTLEHQTHSAAYMSIQQKLESSHQSKVLFLRLAETFQAMGDSSRVQIIWALSHGELSVGEIADLLVISQPGVSHHLRTLRNLRLVKIRKDGRTAYYSLDDQHIENLLSEGTKHVEDLS